VRKPNQKARTKKKKIDPTKAFVRVGPIQTVSFWKPSEHKLLEIVVSESDDKSLTHENCRLWSNLLKEKFDVDKDFEAVRSHLRNSKDGKTLMKKFKVNEPSSQEEVSDEIDHEQEQKIESLNPEPWRLETENHEFLVLSQHFVVEVDCVAGTEMVCLRYRCLPPSPESLMIAFSQHKDKLFDVIDFKSSKIVNQIKEWKERSWIVQVPCPRPLMPEAHKVAVADKFSLIRVKKSVVHQTTVIGGPVEDISIVNRHVKEETKAKSES